MIELKAGEAQVGQKVRTVAPVAAYPEIKVGAHATIVEIVSQFAGAEDDALLIHPHGWRDDACFPCNASDLELVL